MTRADLDDFVACYKSRQRRERAETDRFRRFAHADLIARDKINLDIFWLKDDTLDDPDLLAAARRDRRRNRRESGGRARPLPQGRAELAALTT